MPRLRTRSVLACATLASALVTSLLLARAQVIIVHPGELSGEVTIPVPPGLAPVTQLEIIAAPEGPFPEGEATRLTMPISAPLDATEYSMPIDGGDPDDPNDLGKRYQVTIIATFVSSAARSAQLKIRSPNIVTIDNPNGADTASFSISALRGVTASVQLPAGLTMEYCNLSASANGTQYFSSVSRSFPSGATASLNEVIAFPASTNVSVRGSVQARSSSGEIFRYELGYRLVDLSAADGQVSWTIAASDSSVTGNVNFLAAAPSQPLPDTITAWLRGPITASVLVENGAYSLPAPAGNYRIGLSLQYVLDPDLWMSSTSSTADHAVTLSAGSVAHHDFTQSLSSLAATFSVDGFYDLTNTFIQVDPRRIDPILQADQTTAWAPGGEMRLGVTEGRWQLSDFVIYADHQTPAATAGALIFRTYSFAADPPFVDVPAVPVERAFPHQHVTLSRSTIYLDVLEPAGQSTVPLGNVTAIANMPVEGPDGQLYVTSVHLHSYAAQRNLTPLTIIGEPGEYQLVAFASSGNGTLTFNEPSLFIGAPESSGPGTTVLTPIQDQGLQITLVFDDSTTLGSTSVVKSSLGPAPPSGFASLCTETQTSGACAPTYYNITSTSKSDGAVEMCVRQAYIDLPTADLPDTLATLALWHFRTDEEGQTPTCDPEAPPSSPQTCWEKLPPPASKPRAADCSTNLASCGCTTPEDCGISQGVSVLQVCGLTQSFSPFTVLRSAQRFTASGNGATGVVQTWTAPAAGTYRIRAVGAKGGAGTAAPTVFGGCGAQLSGDFSLAAGDVLQLLVGQRGISTLMNGGGGGGSFVVKNNAPLLVAGGGGGASKQAIVNGREAKLTQNAASGSTSNNYTTGFVAGGTAGRGGSRVASYGAGGGGWSGAGAADGTNGEGGAAFLSSTPGRGGRGAACDGPPYADGGFGGGGAGNGCYGGGGGGGYSGGGGGRVGGGGGSFNAGTNQQACVRCTGSGHGAISIERLN